MDKTKLARLIDELVAECCHSTKYCLLKVILLSAFKEPKMLVQVKCVEKFKFIKSEQAKEDIGWQTAWELWVSEGYAKIFSDLYDENISVSELFKKVIKKS